MKKNRVLLCLLLVSASIAQATQIFNSSNLPIQVKVSYNADCGPAEKINSAEYSFTLAPQQTEDITQNAPVTRTQRGCSMSIISIKATIKLADGTEVSRTWFGESQSFGNNITIGSIYSANSSLQATSLWLR
jgi:hypothetical protein